MLMPRNPSDGCPVYPDKRRKPTFADFAFVPGGDIGPCERERQGFRRGVESYRSTQAWRSFRQCSKLAIEMQAVRLENTELTQPGAGCA
jgi:hypothetical protein